MRLFVAVDPSPGQQEELHKLQRRLAHSLDGIKWVHPEGLHLTLKFLGEQEAGVLPALSAALKGAAAATPPFELQFGGTGVFPALRRARIIWAGLRLGAAEIKALAALLEGELAARGFPVETRPFKAHLTLGRARRPVPEAMLATLLGAEVSFTTERATVRSMRLYESRLSRLGADYRILEETFFVGK